MSDRDSRIFYGRCLAAILLALLLRWLLIGAEPLSALPVERLIIQLGDDDFEAREDAQRELLRRGWWEVGQAVRFRLDHPDAEIRVSCRRIHTTLRERALLSFAPFPMIDAIWLDIPSNHYIRESEGGIRYGHYLDRARGEDDTTGESWGHYRAATRALVRDWLDEGRDEATIRAELNRWHAIDLCWVLRSAPHMDGAGVLWWQRLALARAPEMLPAP